MKISNSEAELVKALKVEDFPLPILEILLTSNFVKMHREVVIKKSKMIEKFSHTDDKKEVIRL